MAPPPLPLTSGKEKGLEERRGVVLRCEREGDCNSRSEGGNFGGGGMKDRRVHTHRQAAQKVRAISVFLANIFISLFFYFLKVNSNILFARCWIPGIALVKLGNSCTAYKVVSLPPFATVGNPR